MPKATQTKDKKDTKNSKPAPVKAVKPDKEAQKVGKSTPKP